MSENKSIKKPLSDEALDQLFREAHAHEHMEPLFQDGYWDEMEALLPEKRKKRVFIPYFISGIAATLLIVLGFYFYPGTTNLPANTTGEQTTLAQARGKSLGHNQLQTTFPENTISQEQQQSVSGITSGGNKGNAHAAIKSPLNKQVVTVQNGKPGSETGSAPGEKLLPDGPFEKEPLVSPVPMAEEQTTEPAGESSEAFFALDKRNPGIPAHLAIPRSRDPKFGATTWFVELGGTMGQSPYVNAKGKRDLVGGVVLGGGVLVRSGHAYFQGGAQLRMEGFKGLTYVENNFGSTGPYSIQRTVHVNQLYSVEFPLSFGYAGFRHQLGINFTPGIQCFISGEEVIKEYNMPERSEHVLGPVAHSSSVTLEMGLSYYYHLNPCWSIGVKFNSDLIRPFRTDYYLGQSGMFPVNGQLILRRNIF